MDVAMGLSDCFKKTKLIYSGLIELSKLYISMDMAVHHNITIPFAFISLTYLNSIIAV